MSSEQHPIEGLMTTAMNSLVYSSTVSPLNSLPPAANPKPTLEIGIITILLEVSIGSPIQEEKEQKEEKVIKEVREETNLGPIKTRKPRKIW